MEAFAILLCLFVLSVPIMMIVALVKLSGLRCEIEELKRLVARKICGESKGEGGELQACRLSTSGLTQGQPVGDDRLPSSGESPDAPATSHEPPAANHETSQLPNFSTSQLPDPAPTALDLFFRRIGDWFCVRGDFAPTGVSREFACATRWLVRIGMLLIVGSLVYFAKLSIDRGWMGPTGRVVAMLFWGAVGVAAGAFLVKRTKYGLVGHAIAALGVVSLYFGFGLGHRFFDPPVIASAGYAFAALFAVTVFAGIIAVNLPSSLIAVLGLVGGYLVPIVAGRDTGSPLGLDAYLLVLNLGAFAVARFRKWSALDFLASALAMFFAFAWFEKHPDAGTSALVIGFVFASLVHLLYMASVIAGAKVRGRAGNAIAWAGLSLGACAYLAWTLVYFHERFEGAVTGLVILGVVAVYLGVATASIRRGWADRQTVGILLVFALAFLALAPVFIFELDWCVAIWAALAVATAEAETRTGEKVLGVMSYLILIAAAVLGCFYLAPNVYDRALGCCDGSVSEYFRAFFLRLVRLGLLPAAACWIGFRRGIRFLPILAAIAVFVCYTIEASIFGRVFLPALGRGAVTLAWTLAAFAGVWFGLSRRVKALRLCALALLGVAVLKLLLGDTERLQMPARVGVFAAVGVALLVGAFLYLKFKERFETHD